MSFTKKRNIALAVSVAAFSALVLTLTFQSPVHVTAQGVVSDSVYDAISSEMITVSSTAIGISAGVLTVGGVPADRCYITTEAQPIRWNTSGTAPTTTVGHLVAAGGVIVLNGRPDLSAFRMIRTGTDASVAVTCSRKTSP